MAKVYEILPEIEGEEAVIIQSRIESLTPEQAQTFASMYRARRKDPQMILLTTLLGFIVVAGVQRFMLNQIGMGLLYLFTGGLCLIGTIVDLVNYKSMTVAYNERVAGEVFNIIRS